MGMSPVYGSVNDQSSLRVLQRFVELGGNFLDTAERYGRTLVDALAKSASAKRGATSV
jgi:aryl-alcohol dehydrogenase-like predicted oxidoreductase